MITLLIATRNAHKVEEIRAVLGERFKCLTLHECPGAPEVIEDASSFAGNATKKAVELAKWISRSKMQSTGGRQRSWPQGNRDFFVLADDSGLEVDALKGAPGVHSARFAGLDTAEPGNSSSVANNAKLLRLLTGVPADKRTARFRCVLALTPVSESVNEAASPVCWADEFELQTRLFDGACEGRIIFELRGAGGFGYDPLFVPEGFQRTFAELSEEEKNRFSHRAKALGILKRALRG